MQKSVREILGNAEVILSTINGASPEGSLKYVNQLNPAFSNAYTVL